jgi:hypothetical protein
MYSIYFFTSCIFSADVKALLIGDICTSVSFDIPSSLVFEKIIDIFNDYFIKLLGSMQDKEKVFKFQGWSNMIYCLPSDLIPKKKIDLLYELLQTRG